MHDDLMDIPYKLVRSRRKTVVIHITKAGEVELRCPMRFPVRQAEAILESKRSWIEKQLGKLEAAQSLPPFTGQELTDMKKAVLPILEERTAHYAKILGVAYGKITVRSQKTLWGSCSRQGDLSFNCLLSQVPTGVLDYVVVHELCHRKLMDHSAAFWRCVEGVLPDYRQRKRWLKEQGSALIRRVP